jgi:hypothetical protein
MVVNVREQAGRPATGRKETIVVRIDSGLLQAVNDLKKGVTLNQVVTTNQDGADYLAANEKLRIANDALRAKNIKQGDMPVIRSTSALNPLVFPL